MVAAACVGCFVLTLMAALAAGYWAWGRRTIPAGAEPSGWGTRRRPRISWQPRWEILEHAGVFLPARRERRAEARSMLVAAGYRLPASVAIYFALKYGLAIGAPALLCPLLYAIRPDAFAVGFAGALGAYSAFRLPTWLVGFAARGRRQDIRDALPDLIDLLVIAVESGLSLDQALGDAAHSLATLHPELTDELYVYRLEMDAGASRADALRNLGRRTGEPDMRRFGSLLIQTERFGTGISRVLRAQSRAMRVRRRQRAEELARQLSVKMIFPIFFLILPSTFLVTAGPAMLYLFGDLRRLLGTD
jgi:tight adherence protein C